jgi:hypothetical protein
VVNGALALLWVPATAQAVEGKKGLLVEANVEGKIKPFTRLQNLES